jgi:hypothetical protein
MIMFYLSKALALAVETKCLCENLFEEENEGSSAHCDSKVREIV